MLNHKKQITMRVNIKQQLSLAIKLGEAMGSKSKWHLNGIDWLVTKFKKTDNKNQIMVYLEEF